MKKLYFILIGFIVFGGVEAQIINFPDAAFKARLVNSYANTGTVTNFAGNFFHLDINGDGEIEVSEALLVKEMNVGGQNGSNMFTNMTGIEYFTNMTTLICGSGNQITTLDVSGLPQLKVLECIMLPIVTLDLTNLVNLEKLNCSGCNQLTNLVVNNNNIINDLNRNSNSLTSLNLSLFPNLKSLKCYYNQLTNLDLSSFTNLENLDCSQNNLTALNITGLNLKSLSCGYNSQLPLINFNQFPNLESLECSNNPLQTAVNLSSCTNLIFLGCDNLQLTSLNLSNSPNIEWLYCSNNLLTTLDLNHLVNLSRLNCSNNNLTTLFVKGFNNPMFGISDVFFDFNPNLNYICCNDSQINYFQYRINNYGYTNCFANSYCSFTPAGSYYVIDGNNRFDLDNNGCNSTDINFPNLKFNLSNGTISGSTICNSSGNYTIPLGVGTFTMVPVIENPTYFNVSPTTTTVTFPTTTSPFTQDFCIAANGTHHDLEVNLFPIGRARPGFDAYYKIVYKNKGTNTQSGSFNLTFNDAVLDYVSATPSVDVQTLNNLTWNFNNLAPFETRTINVVLNLNTPLEIPSLISGDILNYTASVIGLTDETPLDNASILNQTVVNALDPNYKTCTEGTMVAPSTVGKYVHYIIGFENSGTANAQNIVVKDMIDTTKYDITSLVPLTGSATFTTRITNTNQVEFIFQNINLPFTTGSNDGFISFKIKTKPTLVLGDTFSNTANIYFDYNAPIVTNTATTTISALANPTFVFNDYFTLSPIPTKGELNITTKQEIAVSSISIYNTLGQLILVSSNPSKTIDVSNLTSGSYFIKLITDKGISCGKFIKE